MQAELTSEALDMHVRNPMAHLQQAWELQRPGTIEQRGQQIGAKFAKQSLSSVGQFEPSDRRLA